MPLVDCAMYELEGRLMTVVPGRTPCLSCLYPGAAAALEARISRLRRGGVDGRLAGGDGSDQAGGRPRRTAAGRLLNFDLRDLTFHDDCRRPPRRLRRVRFDVARMTLQNRHSDSRHERYSCRLARSSCF